MVGDILVPKEIDASALLVANGTETVTISAVGPTGVGTATISQWIKIRIAGVDCYIPVWT